MTAAHPGAEIRVWAQDEHRLGLLPVIRRVWAPKGVRPIAPVRRRYEWLYVSGFVRPATGETWWCLLPTVKGEAFGAALAEFARDEGVDATHRAVLVLDNAGWHKAKDLAIPDGIDLIFLPPSSPELQPAERLWSLVDEAVANRVLADRAELERRLSDRCRALRNDHRPAIMSRTQYHWWPAEPTAAHLQ